MFFFDACNAVAALEDRKPKYWLGRRHLWVWRCDVTTSNSKCFRLCNVTWIDYLRLSNDFPGFYKRSIWWCDVTTSNSIQDGGALINILVFDLRVQLQHCKRRRKTLLFALIKVITFICKYEILGCNSPLILKCPFSVFPAAMNIIKQKSLSSVLEN